VEGALVVAHQTDRQMAQAVVVLVDLEQAQVWLLQQDQLTQLPLVVVERLLLDRVTDLEM
jgi:hypothetical protein